MKTSLQVHRYIAHIRLFNSQKAHTSMQYRYIIFAGYPNSAELQISYSQEVDPSKFSYGNKSIKKLWQ